MATGWTRSLKSNFKASRHILSGLKGSNVILRNVSTQNLKRSLTTLTNQEANLFKAAKKNLSMLELRNLQKSVAVMSLTSKTSICLGIISTGDGELTETGEESEEACSQGHTRKKRWKIKFNIER